MSSSSRAKFYLLEEHAKNQFRTFSGLHEILFTKSATDKKNDA